jgi:hypothetical protein
MQKEFVTYEIAKELKELGFNEKCMGMYGYEFEFVIDESSWRYAQISNDILQAPLWQQVIEWFRNKDIRIYESYPFNTWSVSVVSNKTNNEYAHEGYQFTLEQAILKAIELCKNRK